MNGTRVLKHGRQVHRVQGRPQLAHDVHLRAQLQQVPGRAGAPAGHLGHRLDGVRRPARPVHAPPHDAERARAQDAAQEVLGLQVAGVAEDGLHLGRGQLGLGRQAQDGVRGVRRGELVVWWWWGGRRRKHGGRGRRGGGRRGRLGGGGGVRGGAGGAGRLGGPVAGDPVAQEGGGGREGRAGGAAAGR